ncbi:MAG: PilN domain-containing protein [Acidobacteriaceae bacterium]|nr:PilN domain-containing protein [Acidobacteriaceae bacterium]
MKIQVNLATRPYVELRPFFLRLRIAMALLALVAVGLGVAVHIFSGKLSVAEQQIDKVHAATLKTQAERTRVETRMRQPDNAEVLDRAHFLNNLFLRKSFSWTAVMMDLEQVLPTGVQVTAIEPQVTQEGDVVIRLRVGGDRDRAVLLVRNLERSRRFLQPRLNGEATQSKEAGTNGRPANPSVPAGVEFDILANYNPLPPNEAYSYPKPHLGEVAAPVAVVPVPRAAAVPPARPAAQAPRAALVGPPRPSSQPNVNAPNGGFHGPDGRFPRNGMRLPPYNGQGGPGPQQGGAR